MKACERMLLFVGVFSRVCVCVCVFVGVCFLNEVCTITVVTETNKMMRKFCKRSSVSCQNVYDW